MIIFFFNDTATTEIYTLSLHDALPIWPGDPRVRLRRLRRRRGARRGRGADRRSGGGRGRRARDRAPAGDRKSTRLNSSHANISYAVFCLKKKKKRNNMSYTYVY